MKHINYDFTHARTNYSKKGIDLAKKEIKQLRKVAKSNNYTDDRCSVNAPFDPTVLNSCAKVLKKIPKVNKIIVIGIGGSDLGTRAVYESIYGSYKINTDIFFLDTVDSFDVKNTLQLIEKELKHNKKIILNVISKSGGTIETTSNFLVCLDLFKKHIKNYKKYIVATTISNSTLYKFSKENGFHILEMNNNIGGRYSVFTQVGIFPLMVLGINCKKLLQGAKDIRDLCLSFSISKNFALNSALFSYSNYKKNRNVSVSFIFSKRLRSLGLWGRQLLAESCGKEFDTKGKKIKTGITPVVSVGSTDLHSLGQLYLGGPDDKMYSFIRVKSDGNIKISSRYKDFNPLISSKSFAHIMDSIIDGTKNAFAKRKKSFYIIEIDAINEYTIGAIMQCKMIETMILGRLLNINPFDQPNVEEYKNFTKKLLKQ